ncbi:selenocysteine-specific translation elongation factor SelB [Oryzisolibacter propanilivorax]|uniref:Selenocysteine-specific elongation factor n=1 Tax=Oryzisolibacter propanilivorax TaxID=1527607 RepID=A0A1G9RGX4_9BURK|nr:selenocysteine-specific translation elongation factor [Oryzisolibacter propanilivorax]SDM21685.1 selenocysteine-specific translation elongation factor SelB [Oryzisolibacter propanilivorax]
MIIGTAGHIDHGKTTLVRALTGVETDRLPEEKRRGISIELGYAYLHADGASVGFVDVPGHERLLHTMLAGSTGVRHALLVVAADDGVMPQTREHLAVLALLGVAQASVAITKIDRLEPAARAARLAQVHAEVRALLAPTPLAGAPLFDVSAASGDGIDALRAHLLAAARMQDGSPDASAVAHAGLDAADSSAGQALRLPIDRAFTLAGVGTVVTGTIASGRVRVGDELALAPGSGGAARRVRVRGIHAQGQPAQAGHAGQRCALALAGVARDEVQRGDWACAPALALATTRIDVQCSLWPDEERALRSGTPVHVHLGTADVVGSIVLLDRDLLEPGASALAQLVLHAPISAWHGDRGVLRDASATRTTAGVRVLDPFAPQRWRKTPERLAQLAAQALPHRAGRLAQLLQHAPMGLDCVQAARAEGLDGPAHLPLPPDAILLDGGALALAPAALQGLATLALGALQAFHTASPDEIGPDARRLKRLAAPRAGDVLWQHLVQHLLDSGAIARTGHWLHLPGHAARLSAAEEQLAQRLRPPLLAGNFDPPWVRTLAADLAVPEALVRQTLASLARRGEAFQVVKDLYYPTATLERLAAIARGCEAQGDGLNAAAFRDATGLGRKRAIQLLEFFNRVGFTRRVKDAHLLRPGTALFAGVGG